MTRGERYAVQAAILREFLMAELGGACAACGARDRLEFDHMAPRTWAARRQNMRHRMRLYLRDAAAGVLRVLCSQCNKRAGQPGRRAEEVAA